MIQVLSINDPPAPSSLKTVPCDRVYQANSLPDLHQASVTLSMLEGLLLLIGVFVVGKSIHIQAHVPGNAALAPGLGKASLGVDD